ncbi:glycoside hydrolase family 2 protein [Hygrophoropsis aurantiaca]|uniref:Glycoside hydrolase family 2 protein n=1 Tax=Hygrophoropsis aurantiaca TaxID=72124 RepID=A0ACB8A888_9AGAM|nr:glycoside hydrolase family 2 protein [Hygrophoropsis aurantiaca]
MGFNLNISLTFPILLLFSLSLPLASARSNSSGQLPPHTFDLSILKWTLINQNRTIAVRGTVPSQVHLDLHAAGVIREMLWGEEENDQRWIVNDNWTYTADLEPFWRWLDDEHTDGQGKHETHRHTFLVFYGIDTVANITFAGHPVAWVNNQFRRYVFDVSAFLPSISPQNTRDNNITIALESAWFYGLNVTSRPDTQRYRGMRGDDYEYPGVRQWIRKASSDFGWDWGPAFVPSGIYKPAYLVTLSSKPDDYTKSESEHKSKPSTSPDIIPSSGHPITSASIFMEESSVDIFKFKAVPKSAQLPFPPITPESADWVLNVTFGLRSAVAFPHARVVLSIPELNISSGELALGSGTNQSADAGISVSVGRTIYRSVQWKIPDRIPERWYPADLGKPKLYELKVELNSGAHASSSRIQTHKETQTQKLSQTLKIGFRTIQIVQNPYPDAEVAAKGITPGDQWHFAINGKAFFAKGTNLIPFDPFYARVRPEAVRWVLESAVRSGQNMLRVWGGGIYQPSDAHTAGGLYDFYALCDELGILIWSELIFSDSLYPVSPFLLEGIEPEVRENVRRINRHPSVAQWAGGNEIEGMVIAQGNWGETRYLDEFVQLFQHFLHDIVVSESNSVPYTACSTTNGVLSLDPYVLRLGNRTYDHIYGNAERFNYDPSEAFDTRSFPVARFVNEFGYHSMPSFYGWEQVFESPDDFVYDSQAVLSRVRHPPAGDLTWPNPNAPSGHAEMSRAVSLWLPTPSTFPTNRNHTFAQWCWSTQLFQSLTMTSQIAFYRRSAGTGANTLGSLVWQLNDIWQGVSWSAVEYDGRWKVLMYGLSGVYKPVVINAFWEPEKEGLSVLVTSDRREEVRATAQMTWYDWHGKSLGTRKKSLNIPALNNSVLFEGTGLKDILPAGYNATDVWLLMDVTANINGKTIRNEQYFTPASLANASLVDPKMTVTGDSNYTFTLSAKGGVAAWAWLDHPSGTVGYFVDPSDGSPTNGFYLIPGIDRTVQFVINAALSTTSTPDPATFVVRSLWNNQNELSPSSNLVIVPHIGMRKRDPIWKEWLRMVWEFCMLILSYQA